MTTSSLKIFCCSVNLLVSGTTTASAVVSRSRFIVAVLLGAKEKTKTAFFSSDESQRGEPLFKLGLLGLGAGL